MMPLNRWLLHSSLQLALLAMATPQALAADITPVELRNQGHLELDARLVSPDTIIVPGQKLGLSLKIATDRWFSGGTRIVLPEVPGLVILQTEQFATNASELREEQSWVVQNWTLDVYPQRAGEFRIPPVTVRVKVNAGDDGDAEGALESPPVDFAVSLPAALANVEQWVAAPDFTVRQRFDRSLDDLQVGDAFEREIDFEASDVMAMMLPTVTLEDLPGLAAYPAPPTLDNSSNRGQTRASRRERISYVVQAEGQYQLPGMDFFWWDTTRGELQLLSLPATVFSVGAGTPGMSGVISDAPVTARQLLLLAAGLTLLAAVFWLSRRYLSRIPLTGGFAALHRTVQALRKPALPERLNPGGSAGE